MRPHFLRKEATANGSRYRLSTVPDEQQERYVNIPTFIFRDRSLAALESIVVYLKDTHGLTYAQIAKLLNRDDRTIWTTYTRAKKKLGGAK